MNNGVPIVPADHDPVFLEAVVHSLRNNGFSAAAAEAYLTSRLLGQLEFDLPDLQLLSSTTASPVSPEKETSAVRERDVNQRQLLEIVPEGVIFTDINGRVDCTNLQAKLLLDGGDGGSLLGKSIFELVSPKDRDRLQTDAGVVLQSGVLHHGEYSVIDASGQARPMELSIAVLQIARQQTSGL